MNLAGLFLPGTSVTFTWKFGGKGMTTTLMAWGRRLAALVMVFGNGAGRRLGWVLGLWLIGLVLLTIGVSWDQTTSTVMLCGSPLPGFGSGREREPTVELLLSEFFSWGWLLIVGVYVLPSVLLPLADSFSVSATLWVRLTPAAPREVAVARLARVLGPVFLLAVLGTTWALLCAAYHDLPPWGLLAQASGLPVHLLCSAGAVAFLGGGQRTDLGRSLLGFLALLLPVALFLLYVTVAFRLETAWKPWWPYACPFVGSVGEQGRHFACAAALGCLLLVLSIVFRTGRVVYPSCIPCEEPSS